MENPQDIYEKIFNLAKTGLLVADENGGFIAANRAFFALSGYNECELEHAGSLRPLVSEDDYLRIKSVLFEIAEGGVPASRSREFKIVKKDGSYADVASTFSFEPEKGLFVATIADITDKKRIKNALIRRNAILGAINYASNRFLKADSWEKVMPDVLRALGESSKVSRIYCFENSVNENTGTLLMNQRFEWVHDKNLSQMNNKAMQKLSYEKAGILRWKETLKDGSIIFADIHNVQNDERINMEKLGVRTSVIAPIFLNDRWWGFLGFDEKRKDRKWTEAEIDTLGAAAGIIGSAIYKQESYEELIAYITESASRLREPVSIVRDNIIQIKKDTIDDAISKENIMIKMNVQVKNLDQILNNLRDINTSIIEKRSEIPKAFRDYISR